MKHPNGTQILTSIFLIFLTSKTVVSPFRQKLFLFVIFYVFLDLFILFFLFFVAIN